MGIRPLGAELFMRTDRQGRANIR